ncbi:MAG: anthranilate phosphoribosyltransferase [Trizodia sp. TS-e1964]|nr:MAG: anthranilate phosphoribosyltransferase [Trizodia sp. TS-e1964]
MASGGEDSVMTVSITPLLKRLWPSPSEANVSAEEIALAISHIFTNQLSSIQTGALLTALHFTGWDRRADILAQCAQEMRNACVPLRHKNELIQVIAKSGRKEGHYQGGLCDIVGTGGDSHATFNISTTSSILASSLLMVAKHGNRAATSKSGSADLLKSVMPLPPVIEAANPETIAAVYEKTNYSFLYAPIFHTGMKHVAQVRRELGWRTIFNLLGPLANPLDELIEARVIGVARKDLGPVFAEALRMDGARNALIICGEEDLDEISCAGSTLCWRLKAGDTPQTDCPAAQISVGVEFFRLTPEDFGLSRHELSTVSPGREPVENAVILTKLLANQMPRDDPILEFVLINTAALFVTAGICEANESNMGFGDDGIVIKERGPGGERWKEGVRRARWAVESGKAKEMWQYYIDVTRHLSGENP